MNNSMQTSGTANSRLSKQLFANILLIFIFCISLGFNPVSAQSTKVTKRELRIAPAPLFKCPIGDAPVNPRVIWNRQEKCWFLFYQQRDKNAVLRDDQALSFCFGSDIGIASSKDNGQSWLYRGIAEGLEIEPGRNTWGAPEVIWHDGLYHLFCEYTQGYTAKDTFGDPSKMAHYTSKDLWHWKFHSFIKDDDDHMKNSICVYQLPTGKWRLYYYDVTQLEILMLESDDLYDWKYIGKNVKCEHNSVNIFKLGGYYWQTIDTYSGYAVFRSHDCENWTRQDGLLFSEVSERMDDASAPHHSGVAAFPDRVYMFYYTHPERVPGASGELDPRLVDRIHGLPHLRRSVIQVAEIKVKDGRLVGNRNEPFDFYMPDQD